MAPPGLARCPTGGMNDYTEVVAALGVTVSMRTGYGTLYADVYVRSAPLDS